MIKPEDILKVARAEIGVTDDGNNKVKYNTEYYGREVEGNNYPWCCVFVWWVFNHAKASKLFFNGKKCASCTTTRNTMIAQKVEDPKAGDLVFFNFLGGSDKVEHIGIVEAVNSDGSITTIEGNTSIGNNANGGAVMRRNRKGSYIDSYIRPMYDVAATKPVKKTNKQVALEVIDGKWGNGDERKRRLNEAGYNYTKIQKIVNDLLRT